MRLYLLFTFMAFCTAACFSQESKTEILSFDEYLGYVKKYHPAVKQANLEISTAQAQLMAARGGFDPKVEIDYAKKQFKGSEYYSLLNSAFKIPTWYGIELKAGFDNSEGIYVNPQNITPNSGLTSVGISIPLAQGLFINQRMADLSTAKLQLSMSSSERQIQVVDLLFKASAAYFNWLKCYNEAALYEEYQRFAQTRFQAVVRSIELGDKPAIDSIEAGIVLKNRKLNVEDANLKLNNARLELSVFLWIDTTPVELQDNIVPDVEIQKSIFETLNLDEVFNLDESVSDNPRIQLLQGRLAQLEIERKLKSNMLLPDISLNYNFISEPAVFNDYRLNDYKAGLSFNLPIFLR